MIHTDRIVITYIFFKYIIPPKFEKVSDIFGIGGIGQKIGNGLSFCIATSLVKT